MAFAAAITAHHAGTSRAQSILTGAGAGETAQALFFAAMSAYH